jgi:hypothetical protein
MQKAAEKLGAGWQRYAEADRAIDQAVRAYGKDIGADSMLHLRGRLELDANDFYSTKPAVGLAIASAGLTLSSNHFQPAYLRSRGDHLLSVPEFVKGNNDKIRQLTSVIASSGEED